MPAPPPPQSPPPPLAPRGAGPHGSTCGVPPTEFCVLCYVERFVGVQMQDRDAARRQQPLVPRALAANIKLLGRHFRVGHQEDSHDFLRCLLERMARAALRAAGVKEGSRDRRDETTAVHRAFGGYLLNQVSGDREGARARGREGARARERARARAVAGGRRPAWDACSPSACEGLRPR
jgi:hypothetical protein